MNVLVFGMKVFDQQVLSDVDAKQVDHWIASGTIVHGDFVRPMVNVCLLQLNYEPEEKA
jgi:hypothetical protein